MRALSRRDVRRTSPRGDCTNARPRAMAAMSPPPDETPRGGEMDHRSSYENLAKHRWLPRSDSISRKVPSDPSRPPPRVHYSSIYDPCHGRVVPVCSDLSRREDRLGRRLGARCCSACREARREKPRRNGSRRRTRCRALERRRRRRCRVRVILREALRRRPG